MTNPYAPPKTQPDRRHIATRLRLASLALFAFGAVVTLPELYSNASDLLQNPIGNLMGVAIIAATSIAAYAEWFPGKRVAQLSVPALVVLAVVASLVIVRFIVNFVPILTLTWAQQHPGIIVAFVFSLSALVYIIAILCRARALANVPPDDG